jgi:hypothetical protein
MNGPERASRGGIDIRPASTEAAEQIAFDFFKTLLELAYRRHGLPGAVQAAAEAASYYAEAASIGDEPEFRRKPNLLRGCAATAFTVEWCRTAIEDLKQSLDRKAA